MKPFFCYYGGKWRVAKQYPTPSHKTIIEPFAGAAGYSLRHHHLDVELYDIDPVICGIWDYLINVNQSEVLALPVKVDHVDDHDIPQEAKWLIGFWLNKGAASPCLKPSAWMRSGKRPNSYWGTVIRDRIASQVENIRHWKIHNESYNKIPISNVTWFVDPPYYGSCGKHYKCKLENYKTLGNWCKTLKGQIIVCEKSGATWLPFKPFKKIKSTPGSRGKSYSSEVIWTTTTSN